MASKLKLDALSAEDWGTNPAQVAAQDFHAIRSGNVRVQNLAQFRGITATGTMPTPDQPVHAQFSDGILDHAGMRIRPSEFQENVLVGPDGAHP